MLTGLLVLIVVILGSCERAQNFLEDSLKNLARLPEMTEVVTYYISGSHISHHSINHSVIHPSWYELFTSSRCFIVTRL